MLALPHVVSRSAHPILTRAGSTIISFLQVRELGSENFSDLAKVTPPVTGRRVCLTAQPVLCVPSPSAEPQAGVESFPRVLPTTSLQLIGAECGAAGRPLALRP